MLEILERYVTDGLLRKAEDENLVQYNYSEWCNNNQAWDDITLFNRGNIYEKSTGKLIAKAMPKFFNFSQLTEEQQKHFLRYDKFINTEKKDGCLGILYKYKGQIRCNSRGGFDNYVTDVIKRLLPKYKHLEELLENRSFNVEVISPETRIICNYGDEENLYLITSFTNLGDYWEESNLQELDYFSSYTGMPRPAYNNYTWTQLFEWQKEATFETEGFVVAINSQKYGAFERVKIKSDDYLKIARIRASLCKHTIWKNMKNDIEQGTDLLSEYLNGVPDELMKTAQRYMDELNSEKDELRSTCEKLAEKLNYIEKRDLAIYFSEHLDDAFYQSAIYSIRNNKPYDRWLIKNIEPELGFEDTVNMLYGDYE